MQTNSHSTPQPRGDNHLGQARIENRKVQAEPASRSLEGQGQRDLQVPGVTRNEIATSAVARSPVRGTHCLHWRTRPPTALAADDRPYAVDGGGLRPPDRDGNHRPADRRRLPNAPT